MYKVACDINDVNVKNCPLDKDFDIDLKTIENLIDHNSRIIFLCSPNNPTGNLLNKEKIKLLAEKFSGIIFIDEAYIDFSDDASFLNYMQQYKNVIVSRTFSKAWGLAGVRCGYCVADEYIINLLFKVKAPYSISRLTANAVINSIKNYQKKNNFIQKLNIEKEKLIGELKRIEFVQKIFPSNANFLLVKLKNASEIYNLLNSKGIRVRIRSDHKRLKNCLRITIGTAKENLMLIKTLKEFDEKK
jgi:histidinol-phosphate aminotransferase